jgi:predicted dienelactone hydrolase
MPHTFSGRGDQNLITSKPLLSLSHQNVNLQSSALQLNLIRGREVRYPIHCLAAVMLVTGTAAWGAEIHVPVAPGEPKFTIPAPQGPHSVGVRAFAWIDQSRSSPAKTNSTEYREIAVQIWYPAKLEDDERPALYFPGLNEMLSAAESLPASEQTFVQAHAVLADTATNSVPGAKILESAQPWPVILFSPGGNVSRHAQTALAERMASQGFVFVAMSHPYSTMDVAPQSGFSMSVDWGLDDTDQKAAAEADNYLAQVLSGDARFVLDQLRSINQLDEPFANALDLRHIGIIGHSRGGTTVGRACATISDIVACAVIDNIGPDRERETGIAQPFLALRTPWDKERVTILHDYLQRTGSVAYDVELSLSNHFSCTDMPLFMSDLRVKGVDPIIGIDRCSEILVPFFDAYLRRQVSPSDNTWVPSVRSDNLKTTRFQTVLTVPEKVSSSR